MQSKQAPEFGSAKSDISGTIVEMLEATRRQVRSVPSGPFSSAYGVPTVMFSSVYGARK